MAQIVLNIPLLLEFRGFRGEACVSLLDDLRDLHSDLQICRSLLEAVDQEYLHSDIFKVFLPWSKSVDVIALCIQDGPSISIRRRGIIWFGIALSDPQKWEAAWMAVGGTRGLIDLSSKISVTEFKHLAKAIGCCNRVKNPDEARGRAVDEFLRALLPNHYPESKLQTHDRRPIQDHCAYMVPACSPEFVEQLLNTKDNSNPLYRHIGLRSVKRLIKSHGELLQMRIEAILDYGNDDHDLPQNLMGRCLQAFSFRASGPKFSESLAFAIRILQFRLKDINNKNWPASISEVDLLLSLIRRSLRKKQPESTLHDIITLGLQLLEAKPDLRSDFQSGDMWTNLITRWAKAPELYEELVVLALRLELGGSEKSIGQNFHRLLPALEWKPELRWPLLRLYCLHTPKIRLDLDTADDFESLANQKWPRDVFFQLRKDQAVRLLKGLQSANAGYPFLDGPLEITILANQDATWQKNLNVVLLLTILERDSEETKASVEATLDELRKKAATEREQRNRAQLAKAASAYAIASGNLDLYGETVIWQQRFVRDPLTLKVIFAQDAIMTKEGIDLLSGIPHPLPKGFKLTEVASRVKKANQILMTFHETMLRAKREPSFHTPDWNHMISLFSHAINVRVSRTNDLQKCLQGLKGESETEIFTAIWSGTLAMLQTVSPDILSKVRQSIQELLENLAPTALAVATKAMLAAGDDKRKKQDRELGDDVLEQMSYDLILRLASGEKPELAPQLILQTILDRPDASSWHRKLLSVSLMNSLPAKDANDMLLAFATAIGEKLEEQSYVKIGDAEPPKSAPPQSLVKITTVKYLAQLLEKAEFISAEAAIDVLIQLFKVGTHRDIRLATLESLLSSLNKLCLGAGENWRSNSLIAKILVALETIIPVAGSVNERRPPRMEDWEEAKRSWVLPEISADSNGIEFPPLLDAMLTAPDGNLYPGLRNLRTEFVSWFIMPIIELSMAEHRKWVVLFLAKHKVKFLLDYIPPVPISDRVWGAILPRYPEELPHIVMDDLNKWTTMTFAPPTALRDFNASLRKNTDLCNTPEVTHWLRTFGQEMHDYSHSQTKGLVKMIYQNSPTPSVSNGITFDQVLKVVIGHASLFLDRYEESPNMWNEFVKDIRPPSSLTLQHLRLKLPKDTDAIYSMVSAWQESGRIMLEKVLVLLLNRKAKHKREQNLSVLPSTTKLQLWLLPYPNIRLAEPSQVEKQCENFTTELNRLLGIFLAREGNVLRWSKIAEEACTVSEILNTADERAYVAVQIGELCGLSQRSGKDQRESALDFIRMTLAMKLVEDGKESLEHGKGGSLLPVHRVDLVRRIRAMLEEWKSNTDENIRERLADWRRENMTVWNILMSEVVI